ncbi:MAG: VWA domain-containing protein [Myxococcales bacterium]|nr:VWA domain-containing protein [Myxococcales bacterium]
MPTTGEIWRDRLEWSLSISNHGWLWTVALLAAIAVLALTAVNARSAQRPLHQVVLVALRAVTITTLLIVLGQPTWVSQQARQDGKAIAVLLDSSASMATGPAGKTRWDRAVAAAQEIMARGGAQLWAVGDRAQASINTKLYTPTGSATDLLGGLRAVRDAHVSDALRAVVIVSDGLDTAELRGRNGPDATALDGESADIVRSLRAPVHAIAIDDPTPAMDIAVTALRLSQFGFARTFMPVAVDIEIAGAADQKGALTLQLLDNGKPLASQQVPIAGLTRRTISMEFQPLHVGTHVIEASITPLPGEATTTNNRAFAGLSVVRDRIRILHLAGQPSWDTRFLRTYLRAAANVDLVSFYIMVGEGAGAYVAGEDTTLIPFPAKEIFEDALAGFDVVILHNFPYGPFQLEQYMPQLSQHIRSGGGLLVLGGPLALSAGGYFGTPLADLLPVQLGPPGDDGGWSEGTLAPILTPLGNHHPVAMLGRDAKESEAAWRRHSIFGRNSGMLPRQGTAMLVTDAKDRALFAVGDVEQGRSAVLATASLWTWAFGADTEHSADAGATGVDQSERDARGDYHRLLNQTIAWLVRDPDYELIRLTPPADPVAVGEPVRIGVALRDGAGEPLTQMQLQWTAAEPATMQEELPVTFKGPLTDERGLATLELHGLKPGAWLIVVQVEWQGRPQRAVVPIVIAVPAVETAQIQPNDRLLHLIAKASAGTVWQGSGPANGIPLAPLDNIESLARAELVHTELWSRPEALIGLLVILCLEWVLRRRWGLA